MGWGRGVGCCHELCVYVAATMFEALVRLEGQSGERTG